MEKLILDRDVIINWLAKETETGTEQPLWVSPAAILELGERKELDNHISLLSIFEIRFVLRRKKWFDEQEIERDLHRLTEIATIATPDRSHLEKANQLQIDEPLDPFDSIILAQSISLDGILITRDRLLLDIANRFILSMTPEDYIKSCLQ